MLPVWATYYILSYIDFFFSYIEYWIQSLWTGECLKLVSYNTCGILNKGLGLKLLIGISKSRSTCDAANGVLNYFLFWSRYRKKKKRLKFSKMEPT